MGLRKSDHPERRKIALMRRADTESGATHNIGGVKKREQRRKPSMPKTPWDDRLSPEDEAHLFATGHLPEDF
jgi:hypothetical protein